MSAINFYRGLKAKYNLSTHGNGIYFTTDTNEIIHAGNSYGIKDSNMQGFVTNDELSSSIAKLVHSARFDKEQSRINFYDKADSIVFSVTLPEATSTSAGLMSAQDKLELAKLIDSPAVQKIESDLGTVTAQGSTVILGIKQAVTELIGQKLGLDHVERRLDSIEEKFNQTNEVEGSVRNLAKSEAEDYCDDYLTWND